MYKILGNGRENYELLSSTTLIIMYNFHLYSDFIHRTNIEIKTGIGDRDRHSNLNQKERSIIDHEKDPLQTVSQNFNRLSNLEWKTHGLQIQNLTDRFNQITVAIVSPHNFKLPGNLQLVSEIYQIRSTQYPRPVKIKIQHCAPKESLNDLCILTSSDECPPYRFHRVDGKFHSNFAEFYVKSFSLYLIVWRKLVGMFNPSRLLYSVSLYSSSKCCLEQESYWNLRFYVVKNLYTHEGRVEKDVNKYPGEWHKWVSSIVQFDRNSTAIEFKPSDKEDHLIVTDITSSLLTEIAICSEQSPPCYYALRLSTKQSIQQIILKFNLKGTANDKHITYIWPGKLGAIEYIL